MGCIAHDIVDILLVTLCPVECHIIRNTVMNQRLSVFICGFRIDYDIQLFEIEHDQLCRILGFGKALGDDKGNVITRISDLVSHENRMAGVGTVTAVPVLERDHAGKLVRLVRFEFSAKDDIDDTGGRAGIINVNRQNLCMGHGGAQHISVQLAFQRDIVRVLA